MSESCLSGNSYFLMTSSFFLAASGFIFWFVAARNYTVNDVGLVSVIISSMNFICMISLLGFDISLTKYISSTNNKSDLINSCFTASLLICIICCSIFWWILNFIDSELIILNEDGFLYFIFVIFSSASTLLLLQNQGVFIGLRQPKYSLILAVLSALRIIILPLLAHHGFIGIYISYGAVSILSFAISLLFIRRLIIYRPLLWVNIKLLSDISRFSAANLIGILFFNLPSIVFPFLILKYLGPKENAYFFIAWAISNVFCAIPGAISLSLLAENSHNYSKINNRNAKVLSFKILCPAIIIVLILSRTILSLFGDAYEQFGLPVLRLLVISSLPLSLNLLYISTKRTEGDVVRVISVYASISVMAIILGYFLIDFMGIIGISIAWFISNSIIAIIIECEHHWDKLNARWA